MKSRVLAASAGLVMAATALVPANANANAAAGGKGTLCDYGTFRVVHKGDKINGTKIKQGNYEVYHRKVSCTKAAFYLHEWLATSETTDGFLVAAGTRGKKSVMFSLGQGPKFFQIKWVSAS